MDPGGIEPAVTAVKGQCANRYTMGPAQRETPPKGGVGPAILSLAGIEIVHQDLAWMGQSQDFRIQTYFRSSINQKLLDLKV